MSNFQITPIEVMQVPNFYAPIASGAWTVIGNNPVSLWFTLNIQDALGTRPYICGQTASLTALFQRMDLITTTNNLTALAQTQRNIAKTATFNNLNRSIGSISLTQQDIQGIVSGGIIFTLIDGSTTTQWKEDWIISKKLTEAGF